MRSRRRDDRRAIGVKRSAAVSSRERAERQNLDPLRRVLGQRDRAAGDRAQANPPASVHYPSAQREVSGPRRMRQRRRKLAVQAEKIVYVSVRFPSAISSHRKPTIADSAGVSDSGRVHLGQRERSVAAVSAADN